MKKLIVLFTITICSFQITNGQNLEIRGNDLIIAGDGSNDPQLIDGTDFDALKIGENESNTFELFNLESDKPDIDVQRIVSNSPHFIIEAKRRIKIKPGKSKSFKIRYEPQSGGIHEGLISIMVRRNQSTRTYYFNVKGRGVNDIMISQSFEDGTNDALEITNLSAQAIESGDFFIGIFDRRRDLDRDPSRILQIDDLNPGETQVLEDVGDIFDGTEVIVISTSNRNKCYADRVDILGIHGLDWGSGRSLTKGACASNSAHLDFDPKDWMEVENSEVNNSNSRQNLYLGRHDMTNLVWDGQDWSDNGFPDRTRIVTIAGDYDGDLGNIEACHLVVETDLNFNTGTKNSVVLYGDLDVRGSFYIGDQESLVMYDDQAQIEGEITKLERSTYRNHKNDMTYWSSPVFEPLVSTVFQGVKSSRIYHYDRSQTQTTDPDASDYWDTWIIAKGNMEQALGYVAEGVAGTTGYHDIQYIGKPNNGMIQVKVHHWDDTNPDNDWNLIGNPYPSAIDIEKFFDQNAGLIDPVIYLWTHNTPLSGGDSGDYSANDYATYNYTGGTGIGEGAGDGPIPEKNIGSAQAFMIRALSSGTAVFYNDMRMEDANDQFFKLAPKKKKVESKDEKDRLWLNLTTDKGGFNQLLIGFLEGATDEVDLGYDAYRLEGGNSISFYSTLGSDKLVIQAVGPFSEEKTIPLGYTSYVAPRIFSIEIAKREGVLKDRSIYLHDNFLGVRHDLTEGAYDFEVTEANDDPERFTLEFQTEATLSLEEEEMPIQDFTIYNQQDIFYVRSKDRIRKIRIYNILGALIHESYPQENNFEFMSGLSKKGDVLLIDIQPEVGRSIKKKILHQ